MVHGANYSLGANPENLSYCSGVGDNAQHFHFIVDAQVTGQAREMIVGHIPYGQGNEGNAISSTGVSWLPVFLKRTTHSAAGKSPKRLTEVRSSRPEA